MAQKRISKIIWKTGLALAAVAVLAVLGAAAFWGAGWLERNGRHPTVPPPTTGTQQPTNTPAATPAPTRPVVTGLSDSALVQQLIEMILHDARFDELFATFPESQRADIDSDTFYQYVALLRSGIRGRITSYAPLSASEIAEVRQDILSHSKRYAQLTETLTGYWLVYENTAGAQEQFAVFLHQKEDGGYYFSRDWIDGVLSIQAYGVLYFDAVEKGNVDALSVLVDSVVNDPAIRAAKAVETIRFYQRCIPAKAGTFRLLQARIDSFVYEQSGVLYENHLTYRPYFESAPRLTPSPGLSDGEPTAPPSPTPQPTVTPGLTSPASRTVEIVKEGFDRMRIIDLVPVNPARDDMSVYALGKQTLALGEYAYSFELNTRFGFRLSYDAWPASAPFDPNLRIIRAYYQDATITLVGTADDRLQAFQGHVYGIELHGGDWRTGSGLAVGDPRKAVLLHFPYADVWDWSVGSLLAEDRAEFVLSDGLISEIRLGRQSKAVAEAIARATRFTPTPSQTAAAGG